MGSRKRRKSTNQSQHDKWHKMDMNEHATILWKISPEIKHNVQNLKPTKEIWETLQTMYARTSKVIDIKRKLTHIKMKGDGMNLSCC